MNNERGQKRNSMVLQKESFIFDASHPRRSPRATLRSKDRLRCIGNKYVWKSPLMTPWTTTDASAIIQKGAPARDPATKVNVILGHANGFNKELYEPMIARLLCSTCTIAAVFVHDVVSQGASGLLNADILGDEYSWSDSGRDLLCMIEHLRRTGLMEHDYPLVGLGHSMGGCQIAYAAMLHERLFESLILVDPVIDELSRGVVLGSGHIASLSAKRRDRWPSRADARAKFLKSPFYQSWDPEVFERWMQYGVMDTGIGEQVRLTTTSAQEVYSFLQYLPYKETEATNPDTSTFVYRHLKFLVLPVHLIYGEHSTTIRPEGRARILASLQHGTRVDVEGCGHLVPMEKPGAVADLCAHYIELALQKWTQAEQADKTVHRTLSMTDAFRQQLKEMLESEKNKGKSRL